MKLIKRYYLTKVLLLRLIFILLIILIINSNLYSDYCDMPYLSLGFSGNCFRVGYEQWTTSGDQLFRLDQMVFPIPFYLNDTYNGNNINFSLATIYQPLFTYIYQKIVNNPNNYLIPSIPLNFELHFIPIDFWDFPCRKSISLFIKNNSDIFFIREHDWIEISPGIGLAYQSNPGIFSIVRLGFVYHIDYIKSSIQTHPSIYLMWSFSFLT